ncbi:MAG: hypothetical protein ACREFX_09935, partial [Opitutaceae bacterium]
MYTSSPDPIATTYNENIVIPIETIVRQDGAPTPELAKWHWNLITNYAFTSGILKNWNVGGGIRFIDGQAIGYPVTTISQTINGSTSTAAVADVRHAYYSPNRTYYDASVGYTIPHLYKGVSWHIQFYVRNIGIGDRLIPVGANPDGSIDAWEIDEPMTWTLANTFKF